MLDVKNSDVVKCMFAKPRMLQTAVFSATIQHSPKVMFTYELARRLEREKLPVVANVVDPGVVDTELQRYLPTPVGWGNGTGPK